MNFLTSRPRPSGTGAGRATIIGGDERALREFVAQWMSNVGFMGETTIYIGQLPPTDAALPMPHPKGAQIVGTILRETTGIEILALVSTPPEQAFADYEQALLAGGWSQIEDLPTRPHGFSDRRAFARRYCNDSAKAALFVTVGTAADGATVLRLNLSHEPKPCAPRGMGYDIYQYLPDLQTPPGVTLLPFRNQGMGGGGNPGSRTVSSSAGLSSELSPAEIAQAYNDQLSALGWQQISAEAAPHFACSSWVNSLEDTPWSLTFTLAADPISANEYQVWLHLSEREE